MEKNATTPPPKAGKTSNAETRAPSCLEWNRSPSKKPSLEVASRVSLHHPQLARGIPLRYWKRADPSSGSCPTSSGLVGTDPTGTHSNRRHLRMKIHRQEGDPPRFASRLEAIATRVEAITLRNHICII